MDYNYIENKWYTINELLNMFNTQLLNKGTNYKENNIDLCIKELVATTFKELYIVLIWHVSLFPPLLLFIVLLFCY